MSIQRTAMIPLRDENPTRRTPVVTSALIALNVAAFLWERALIGGGQTRLLFEWGMVPARLMADPLGGAHTLVTSMFMHSPESWWHLAGNMLFLWIFGDNVEEALGRGRYLGLYFLSGLAAAVAQIVVSPDSVIPMVGASGAIAGVLAAYGSLYPRAPVLVLNPVIPLWFFFGLVWRLPAWIVIAEFFVMNLFGGLATLGSGGGGVAFFAHLGGFVAGLFAVRALVERRRPQQRRQALRQKTKIDPWDGWQPPPREQRPAEVVDWRFPSGAGRPRSRYRS